MRIIRSVRVPPRVAVAARTTARLVRETVSGFLGDGGTQLSAAIAYHVLFSIFPLLIVMAAIAGLVVSQDTVRNELIDAVLSPAGLSDATRAELEERLRRSVGGFGAVGLVGLVALVWSASGMMGALRHAINVIFGADSRRSFVRGKLVDFAFLAGVWLLLGASFAGTLTIRALADTTAGRDALPEALRDALAGGMSVLALILPVALSFATFTLIYRVLPAVPTRVRDVWPGALGAAVLLEVAKNALAVYFTNFGSYDDVYGSLGGIISFLFFVYVGAIILLLGAEAASRWPEVRSSAAAGVSRTPN